MFSPQYEKAAFTLSSNDPPIVLAKVDANEEANRGLASEYQVQGFPTIKILRNGGKDIQEFKGPRDAAGIVEYLKKQVGPASTEIKSVEDAAGLVDEKKISIVSLSIYFLGKSQSSFSRLILSNSWDIIFLFQVGVFPKFSGEEYDNFVALAEKLRSDYDFGHTLDAKLLPKGESVTKPTLRVFKPFDELVVDSQVFLHTIYLPLLFCSIFCFCHSIQIITFGSYFTFLLYLLLTIMLFQDFKVEAMEKFIEESTIPILTVWNSDPSNHPYVNNFFEGSNDKVLQNSCI